MIALDTVLNQRKCALVIVDVQNEFCHPEGAFGQKGLDLSRVTGVIEPLRKLIAAAHEKGAEVVFIKNVEDEGTDSEAWLCRPDGAVDSPNQGVTRRGTWGAEMFRLEPAPGDLVVEKFRFSAFHGTGLHELLQERGVRTLVMGGLATNVCVMTTATHAVMYDYHVVLAEDACAAWFQDVHDMALKNLSLFVGKVLPSAEIIETWKKG